jgi:hypothetical protein
MIGKEQATHIYTRRPVLPPPLLYRMYETYTSVMHLSRNFDLVIIIKLVPRRVKETGSRWV